MVQFIYRMKIGNETRLHYVRSHSEASSLMIRTAKAYGVNCGQLNWTFVARDHGSWTEVMKLQPSELAVS